MDQILYMPFFVAMVAIVVLVGLPILTWILFRLLAHRERMAMIRHGYAPPMGFSGRGGRYPSESEAVANMQLRRGVSVAFIGLALLIGLSFIGYDDGRIEFGPWLLGGLVPLFFGLAQMLNAFLGGARFGAPRAGPHAHPTGADGGPPPFYESQQSESQKRPPV
jgi:hypothetical protein